jgi:hypothetical protein
MYAISRNKTFEMGIDGLENFHKKLLIVTVIFDIQHCLLHVFNLLGWMELELDIKNIQLPDRLRRTAVKKFLLINIPKLKEESSVIETLYDPGDPAFAVICATGIIITEGESEKFFTGT